MRRAQAGSTLGSDMDLPHRPAGPDPRPPGYQGAPISRVPVLLQACVHLLIAALLIVVITRAFTTNTGRAAAITGIAIALGLVYAAGPVLPAVRRSVAAAAVWLAAVLAIWLALLVLTPDAIWLAFPWFFLLLHLLPWRAGVTAVVLTTAAAVGGFAWHQGGLTVGTAIGPVLGAAVAIATVWGYTSVAAESDRRRALIAELRRTRAELAAAERSAGAIVERERLAREIHDTLAQGLSSIQLLLRAAARTLPEDGPADPALVAQARLRIEQAREAAQDNLAEARRFVAELAPPGLQGRSLPAALQRLCDTTKDRTGLPVDFRLEGGDGPAGHAGPAIPTPIEVALLRIAQSSLANVTGHAAASKAGVTLTVLDTAIALDIVDDGIGFDPAAVPDRDGEGGFGLSAMRSRVAELGGTLDVESAPGQGTAVAVTFPLSSAGGPS